MPTVRQMNIAKSKAAGVAVGEYSELEKPRVGKIHKRRSHQKSHRKTQKAKNKNKDIATIREERDALWGKRRVPGSFENGGRR